MANAAVQIEATIRTVGSVNDSHSTAANTGIINVTFNGKSLVIYSKK